MAKLSARGRVEILRVSITAQAPADDTDVLWRRTTRAYMSDGRRLSKYDVRFKASQFSPEHTHSYGWKVDGKVKAGINMDEVRQRLVAKGWTVESA